MKSQNYTHPLKTSVVFRLFSTILIVMATIVNLYAQDGNSGITAATTQVKSYFSTGTSLMYAIGALSGLVGAIKVYKKWNDGEHDTGKVASSWFGSMIFLVIVATVIKSFFGV